MIEQGRISGRQMAFLIQFTILPTSIILLPGMVYQEAGPSAWFSILLVGMICIGTGLVVYSLGTRFPDQTIIQYSENIVGKPLGKIIGLVYITIFIYTCALIVREITNMFQTSFMNETPQIVFAVGLVLTAAYTVRHGLEVMARVSDVILPLGIVMFLLLPIFTLPEMNTRNFLPFLERGPLPVLKGSYLAAQFLGEIFVIAFFLPYLQTTGGIKRTIVLAGISVTFFQLIITVTAIGVLGSITAHFNYTTLQLASYITLGTVVDRVEPLIMLLWIGGGLIKIGVFYYCSVLAMAQWLGLREYKALVLPTGALVIVLSSILWRDTSQLLHYLTVLLPPVLLSAWLGVPLILFILAWLFGKGATQP